MKLTELISILSHYQTIGQIDTIDIKGIEIDHRLIKTGCLFVCIEGFTVNGHDFVEQAIKKGAVAVVSEKVLNVSIPTVIVNDTTRALAMLANKFYQFPSREMLLIGVTGTNGKTTTTHLLEAIFKTYHKKTGLIGTIQARSGEHVFNLHNTTPHALILQKIFKQMRDDLVEVVCMEVSSHALDLGRVYGLDYNIAIYTNLSQDHLDYHRSMEEYFRTKSLLFAQLGNTYREKVNKFAIVNEDDPYAKLIKRSTSQHILTYGCKKQANIMAKNINLGLSQTCFTLVTPNGTVEIVSKLIGIFNVYNMLAAAGAAIAAKVPVETIKAALENVKGIAGRFERVTTTQRYSVIVDYAHTPDSLENVLQTISDFVKGDIYVVVGCGGNRDRLKRPQMAQVALKYAKKAIFTTDNPRTENPQTILQDMTKDIKQTHYRVIVDRKTAIKQAIDLAKAEDVVLIAGKGHETYQEIGLTKYDFDDRKVAREAIKNKELK